MTTNANHGLFRTRNGRRSRDDTRFATYRVKTTVYMDGGRKRTYTDLMPANSSAEAENLARSKYPSKHGYHFDTKRVADFWREYE